MKWETRYALLLSATLLLAFGQAKDARLTPPGLPEVLRDTEATLDQLAAAILKADATLHECNALADGDVSSASTAKREAEESIKKLQERSEKLQSRVKKMNDRADEFFKKWEDSLEQMKDIERVSSLEMRDDSWKRYRKIADDVSRSGVELRPVIEDLKHMLERFDGEGRRNRRQAFDELKKRTVHWLEEVRKRYRDAENELQALEREVEDGERDAPETP